MIYALTIETSRKNFGKAVAAMKRYGGTFDGDVWLFEGEVHPAASQWGTVEEYGEAEVEDIDYDHQAAAGI